jgi:ABC-type multidrug transport system ATPase subunit
MRQVSYVSKTEDHLAHLTLRETMLFAARIKSLKYETDEDIQQSVDRHIRKFIIYFHFLFSILRRKKASFKGKSL